MTNGCRTSSEGKEGAAPVPCSSTTRSAHAKASLPARTKEGKLFAMLFKHIMAHVLLSVLESVSTTRTRMWSRAVGSRCALALACFPNTNRAIDRMASNLQPKFRRVCETWSGGAVASMAAGVHRHTDTGSSCSMMRKRIGRNTGLACIKAVDASFASSGSSIVIIASTSACWAVSLSP